MNFPRGNGILQQRITDKQVLYSMYMPFVKGGGLFLPTSRQFVPGEEVFLSLSVLESRFGISCKVVWMTPMQQGDAFMNLGKSPESKEPMKNFLRATGAGLQFVGGEAEAARQFIENQLTGMLSSDRPTQTM